MKGYRTVRAASEIELVVQKSRFIGRCFPVTAEDEALAHLERIRKQHWDASHNCYAYVVREGGKARYSDDGEPGGTAGLPMMEVLKARELADLLVVATRYFGGVLLGAGGLVRAYSKTAAQAVNAAGAIDMIPSARYALRMSYPLWGRLESKVLGGEWGRVMPDAPQYAEDVTVEVVVPEDEGDAFVRAAIEASDGKVAPQAVGRSFAAWDAPAADDEMD